MRPENKISNLEKFVIQTAELEELSRYQYPFAAYDQKYIATYLSGVKFLDSFEPTSTLVEFVSRNRLRRGVRVVEFGCGEGRDALFLAKRGCRVLGIDTSAAALGRALLRSRREQAKSEFMLAEISSVLPFADSSFDLALNIDSIHLILTRKARLSHFREARRVLSNEGFYFLCAHTGRRSSKFREGASKNTTVGPMKTKIRLPIPPAFVGTATRYQKELEAAGFSVIEKRSGFAAPIPAHVSTIISRKDQSLHKEA